VSSSSDRRRRGLPDPARTGEAEGLGAVLDALSQQRPWRPGLAVGELGRRWSRVVGDRLAEESTPGGLDGGVLTVRASSAAWATQIRFLSDEVARRSNEVLGGRLVGSVRVVVDPRAGAR